MENEILDYDENWNDKLNYRKYYLLIESVLVFPLFWLLIIGGSSFNYNKNIDTFLGQVILPVIVFFYLVTPIIKYARKETSSQLSLLYFLQNSIFFLSIIGLIYFESILLALTLGGSSLFLFILIPHLEIKKYDATRTIHLILFFINLAFVFSLIGLWIYGSSSATKNPPFPISLLGSLMSFSLFFVTFFLAISNWNKYYYLGYYFPRLMFAISFGVFQVLYT